jgi:hypothetical protein
MAATNPNYMPSMAITISRWFKRVLSIKPVCLTTAHIRLLAAIWIGEGGSTMFDLSFKRINIVLTCCDSSTRQVRIGASITSKFEFTTT